jgi:hypothetical protein
LRDFTRVVFADTRTIAAALREIAAGDDEHWLAAILRHGGNHRSDGHVHRIADPWPYLLIEDSIEDRAIRGREGADRDFVA